MTDEIKILTKLNSIKQNIEYIKIGEKKGSFNFDYLTQVLSQIEDLERSIKVRMEYCCPVCEKRFVIEQAQLAHYDNEHGIKGENKIAV